MGPDHEQKETDNDLSRPAYDDWLYRKKVNVSDSLSAYKNYTADISVTETKQPVMQITYVSGNQNCGEVIFRTMPDSPSDMVVVYDEKNTLCCSLIKY